MHAIVTGAASGLGEATARKLVALGYRVGLCDIDAGRLQGVAEALGANALAINCDVTDERSVADAFDVCEDRAGPVQALICCAGGTFATRSHQPSLADVGLDEWDRTLGLNARSAFLCVRQYFRARASRPVNGGSVVPTSSTAATRAALGAGIAYSAGKAAIIAIARHAALEGAAMGITVNTIVPGGFDTPAFHKTTTPEQTARQIATIPAGRLGEPAEFAELAAFLISAQARYISGAAIDLSGAARMP